MFRLALPLLAWTGCTASGGDASVVHGSRGDVTTAPGTYDGFDVVAPCPGIANTVGVLGRGAVSVDAAAIQAHGRSLLTAVEDVASLWGGGGIGLGCIEGAGTTLFVDDWRDVDPLIARTGAFVRERDLALQVVITVEAVPQAH